MAVSYLGTNSARVGLSFECIFCSFLRFAITSRMFVIFGKDQADLLSSPIESVGSLWPSKCH